MAPITSDVAEIPIKSRCGGPNVIITTNVATYSAETTLLFPKILLVLLVS